VAKALQPRNWFLLLLIGFLLVGCDKFPSLNGTPDSPVPTPGAIPTLPPVVTTFAPGGGLEVPRDQPITLHFSQPMDRGSVEQALTIEPSMEGTPEWQDDQTLVFRPKKVLPAATRYRVQLAPSARSQGGLPLPSEVKFSFSTQGPLVVAYFSPLDTAAELRVDVPILISFNKAVVPVSCTGKTAGDTECPILPITTQPPTGGATSGYWVNTSVYRYIPSQGGWAAGVSYKVVLAPDVLAVDGSKLEAPVTWSFSTATPQAVGAYPEDKSTGVPLDTVVRLSFNTAMDREASGNAFSIASAAGAPIPGSITWEDNGAVLVFTPTRRLELATRYVVQVTTRARALTSAPLQNAVSWSFTTVDYPEPVAIYPEDGGKAVDIEGPVRVRFAGLISESTLSAHVLISPEVTSGSVYTYWDGDTYNVSWKKQPQTRYCVSVQPGVADIYGNQSQNSLDSCFTTGNLRSLLAPVSSLDPMTLDAAEPMAFYFLARNAGKASFVLEELGEKQFVPYDGGEGIVIRNWSVRFEGATNEVELAEIGLNPPRGEGLTTGYYRLSWSGNSDWWRTSLRFAVVDRHLMLKISQNEVVVWVTDLRSAEPAVKAEVRLVAENGVLLGAGTTDSDGVARIPIGERENLWERVAAIVGTPGEPGFGITISDWNMQASPWDFGFAVDSGPYFHHNLYLYTDRPIYRPGQSVNFRGIVRQDFDARYTLPDPDTQVLVTLRDMQWNEIYSTTVKLNDLGNFSGNIRLDSAATAGGYTLEGKVAGVDRTWSIPLMVAAYRKPEFEVKVTPEREDLLQGTPLRAVVDASYYFGGAVSGAKVHWTIRAESYQFQPDLKEWWDWNNQANTDAWSWQEPMVVAQGDGTIDDQGRFMIQTTTKLQPFPDQTAVGPQVWTVEAQVTDESGFPVTGQGQLTVHQGSFYLGMRPKSWVTIADQRTDIELLALDWDGIPVEGQSVEVLLLQRTWYEIPAAEPFQPTTWGYTDTQIFSTTTKTDAQGRGKATVMPPRSGSYVVMGRTMDKANNRVVGETYLWVSGPEAAAWKLPEGRVLPTADAQKYEVGQTARILLPTPFKPPFQVLMTVERSGILDVRRFTATEPNPVVELPIQAAHVPNVYVSFIVVQGVTSDTLSSPDVRVGMVELVVDPVTQTLQVELIPDRNTIYNPGDPVTLTVRTLDASGATVDAEVGISVVDKAVLALARPNSSPLLSYFYAKRPVGVVTGDSLLVLFNRISANLEELSANATRLAQEIEHRGMGGGGGGDGGAADSDVRRDFPDTAYWNAQVRTGSAGEAQVTFKLPDSLTTWVVDARAVTFNTQLGQTTTELVVSKPLLVRPVTPRFFVGGDRAEVGAVVHNNTGIELKAKVRLEATGVKIDGEAEQEVTLPAGGRVRVNWKIVVPEVEISQALLTFSVDGGEYHDAARPAISPTPGGTLPVYHYESPDVTATSGMLEGAGSRWEVVLAPVAQSGNSGEVQMTIDPSLASGLTSGLKALEGYPYETTENLVSRFLPNMLSYRTLRQLEIQDPTLEAALQLQVADALERLYSRQHQDGGWGWWNEAESNPLVSAYATFGMLRAREAGFPIREPSLTLALDYLVASLSKSAAENKFTSIQAFMLMVVTEGKRSWPDGVASGLYSARDSIGVTGRGYLALTLGLKDPAEPRVKTLLSSLRADAKSSATGTHWEDFNVYQWATDTRATAVVIETLTKLAPDDPLLPEAVRWLMIARKGSQWETSQETSWALIGLSDYMAMTGELQGNYTWAIALNGVGVGKGVVNSDTLRTPSNVMLPFSKLLPGQANALEIARSEGVGRLYYTTRVKSYAPAAEVDAESRGIDVRREYCQPQPLVDPMVPPSCVPVNQVHPGDLVEVHLTLTLPENRYYLILEDPYPAGMEPVNSDLLTEGSLPGPEGEPLAAPVGHWWQGPFNSSELRDERAVFFAASIGAGSYQVRYLLRVTSLGEYHVLPAVAYESYFPEVWGRSTGAHFTIEAP